MVTEKKKRKSTPTPKRKAKPQFVVDSEGRRTAVIIPIEDYQALVDDRYDLGLIAEARGEPTFSLEEMEARLRKNGVLPG